MPKELRRKRSRANAGVRRRRAQPRLNMLDRKNVNGLLDEFARMHAYQRRMLALDPDQPDQALDQARILALASYAARRARLAADPRRSPFSISAWELAVLRRLFRRRMRGKSKVESLK